MPESVRLYGGLRLDAPDAAAMQALMHTADEDVLTHQLGVAATGNSSGVISGMTPGNYAGIVSPYPLNAVPIILGWFLDSARRVTYHDGVTGTVDMTAIAAVNGSKIWARRSATLLEEDTEDRVTIVASVETQAPATTRLRHVLQFTATTGATPSGDGWAEVMTIASWTTASGVPVPNSWTRLYAWKNKGTLIALIEQICTEIAEIKGVASSSWETGPDVDLADARTELTNLNVTVAGIGLVFLHKDHAEEDAASGGGIGNGLHIKAAGFLVSNGTTLSIQSDRGRGLASIVKASTGLYTLTLDFNGNPAAATMAVLRFVPYLGSGNVHSGVWVEPDPVVIWSTYAAGSTTIVFRVSQSGSVTDLLTNEGILVEVY